MRTRILPSLPTIALRPIQPTCQAICTSLPKAGLQASPRQQIQVRPASYSSHQRRRARQMERHIDSLISHSPPTPATATAPSPPPIVPSPQDASSTLDKARLVFGSRLSGESTRRAELDARSTIIAGVKVPPKPEEPDNCCMSGCVNCVWDRFREELEEWAEASREARSRMQAQGGAEQEGEGRKRGKEETYTASSMDDDGGGSEGLWSLEEVQKQKQKGQGKQEEDLFEGIPIGIRAFIENEKKLKARRRARGEDAEGVDMETKARWLER